MLSEVWKPGPSIASAQSSPEIANQLNSRCRPIASTVISTSAKPIDRHRIERIGGDRICESALTAASNMAVLPLVKKPSREVDTPEGFDKGFDESLSAPGETRLPSKTRGCHDPRPGTLSRQQNHPARGGSARRPAAREGISVDGSEAALDTRRVCRGCPALRGRLVPAGKDLSAIRRRPRHHRNRGLAARRLRRRAGAERARRQRGAGLRRCRSRDGGLGHGRAQPGQCQPLGANQPLQTSGGSANCATPAPTSRL